MIQDFCDSGHMNKENREHVRRTLMTSRHRHNSSIHHHHHHHHHHPHSHSTHYNGEGEGRERKKSTISDLFSSSRRASAYFHKEANTKHQLQTLNINEPLLSSTNDESGKLSLSRRNSRKSDNIRVNKSSSQMMLNASDENNGKKDTVNLNVITFFFVVSNKYQKFYIHFIGL